MTFREVLGRWFGKRTSAEAAARWQAVIRPAADGKRDWDAIISAGEARIASLREGSIDRLDVALPLGVAYHQRASRSWIQGDATSALADVDRAIEIDPFVLAYGTTRAVLLDALGRRSEAYHEIDSSLRFEAAARRWQSAFYAWRSSSIDGDGLHREQALAREEAKRALPRLARESNGAIDRMLDRRSEGGPLDQGELARAHATRGLIALREGKIEQAEHDLRHAVDVQPSAFHAHCLGAVLYTRGDLAGAARSEERSVELEPSNAGYRWALSLSLRKLGRADEARRQAEQILELGPEAAAAYRQRIARTFGQVTRDDPR
jgi:tetratricopeptide (TPR) repeat protein